MGASEKIITVTSITLNWTEGLIATCEEIEGKSFATVVEFDRILDRLSREFGSGGGYCKTDVTILLSNGDTYGARLSVTKSDPDHLVAHLRQAVRHWSSNDARGPHREECLRGAVMTLDALVATVTAPAPAIEPSNDDGCLAHFLGL